MFVIGETRLKFLFFPRDRVCLVREEMALAFFSTTTDFPPSVDRPSGRFIHRMCRASIYSCLFRAQSFPIIFARRAEKYKV